MRAMRPGGGKGGYRWVDGVLNIGSGLWVKKKW